MCVCELCRGWQTAKANMLKRTNNYRGGDEMPSVKWMVLSVSGGFSQFRKLKKIGTFCCWLSMRNCYFTNWHMQHIDDLISCFHSLCLPSIQMVSLFRPLSLSRFPSVSIRLCMNPSIFPISFCMPTTSPVVLNHLNKRDCWLHFQTVLFWRMAVCVNAAKPDRTGGKIHDENNNWLSFKSN